MTSAQLRRRISNERAHLRDSGSGSRRVDSQVRQVVREQGLLFLREPRRLDCISRGLQVPLSPWIRLAALVTNAWALHRDPSTRGSSVPQRGPGERALLSLLGAVVLKEEERLDAVDAREGLHFNDVHAALARFALGDEALWAPEFARCFGLRQSCAFPRPSQPSQERRVVCRTTGHVLQRMLRAIVLSSQNRIGSRREWEATPSVAAFADERSNAESSRRSDRQMPTTASNSSPVRTVR